MAIAIDTEGPATEKLSLAELRDWRQIVAGLRFPDYGDLPAELATQINAFNGEVAKLTSRIEEVFKGLDDAIALAESGSFGEFYTAVGQLQCDRGCLAERAVKAWALRGELAEACHKCFVDRIGPLETAHAETVEKVRRDFTAMGSGLDGMPGHYNGTGGEVAQLDWMVHNRNRHTRAAAARLQNACALRDAAAEQRRQSVESLKRTREFLARLIKQSAGL